MRSIKVDVVLAVAIVVTLLITFAVFIAAPSPARCDDQGCFGGMCMTSAACVPGCACIANRCS